MEENNKKKTKIRLVSCGLQFAALTNKLSEKDYAVGKLISWLSILKDNMYPVKWNNPTTKGTHVECKPIESREEANLRFAEYKDNISFVNKSYGLDLKITFETDKSKDDSGNPAKK